MKEDELRVTPILINVFLLYNMFIGAVMLPCCLPEPPSLEDHLKHREGKASPTPLKVYIAFDTKYEHKEEEKVQKNLLA